MKAENRNRSLKISEAAEDQETKESFVAPCPLGGLMLPSSVLGLESEFGNGNSRTILAIQGLLVDRLNSREEFSTDMASQASSNFRGPWSPILVVYGSLISRLSTLLLGNEDINSFLGSEKPTTQAPCSSVDSPEGHVKCGSTSDAPDPFLSRLPFFSPRSACNLGRGKKCEWTCGMVDMIGSFRATKTPADSRNGIRSTSLVGFLSRIICTIFFW